MKARNDDTSCASKETLEPSIDSYQCATYSTNAQATSSLKGSHQKGLPVAPESSISSALNNNRRGFLRKAALGGLATAAGIGAVPLLSGRKIITESSADSNNSVTYNCPTGTAITGRTCSGVGVLGCSTDGCAVKGCALSGTGVIGRSIDGGTGVVGCSIYGTGVSSSSYCCACCQLCGNIGVCGLGAVHGVVGTGSTAAGVQGVFFWNPCSGICPCCVDSLRPANKIRKEHNTDGPRRIRLSSNSPPSARAGVVGTSCFLFNSCIGSAIGVLGIAGTAGTVPLAARGSTSQSANLQEWQNASGAGLSVVNKAGWFGIGTDCPNSPICVLSCVSSVARFSNNGLSANKSVNVEFRNGCTTASSWFTGVGGPGNSHCVTNGQFFFVPGSCAPRMVLNRCGKIGIGTIAPNTTLQINGSVSAKTVMTTKSYKMGASDFAVLGSGKIKVTLPPASTATGMIVFIKNVSTSTVTIEAFTDKTETDTVEGAASKDLKKQYDSLQLISNGSNEWYILGNSICAAFTS